MEYTPLETKFTKKGWTYEQIKRVDDFAIFSQIKGEVKGFEVIIVGRHKEYTFPNGIKIPPGEQYPSNTQWGLRGWTYTTLEAAEKKFDELVLIGKRGPGKPKNVTTSTEIQFAPEAVENSPELSPESLSQ